tara:strand:+ start:252 stop:602 length:351 start_codon:yes stop_codon:yes gene_type:complete
MASKKDRGNSELRDNHPDWNWDYWEAQVEGFKKTFRKPIWRDYLETQRKKLDKVHDFFWLEEESLNGGESTRRREESNEEPARHAGKKLSPPVPPVSKAEEETVYHSSSSLGRFKT